MPPKTRGGKIPKALKENLAISNRSNTKAKNTIKLPRKALADKTNSASDDNASFLQSKNSIKVVRNKQDDLLSKQRPRRERRVPTRYIENNGLQNLSSEQKSSVEIQKRTKCSPKNNPIVVLSPLKTPKSRLDSSLAARRPKRICRLPSKFDDHSISPTKFVPVQPSYASTPKVVSKNTKQIVKDTSKKNVSSKQPVSSGKVISTKANKKIIKKNAIPTTHSPNSSADTNNNAKKDQLPHNETKKMLHMSPKVRITTKAPLKKVTDKNFSFKILEDKKKSLKRDASILDVYEFTYDPNEEPPPQKKKRKRPAKKREPKPKTFTFKSSYDKNLAKALAALKNTVTAKSTKHIEITDNPKLLVTQHACIEHPVVDTVVTTINTQPLPSEPTVDHNSEQTNMSTKNYNSVRVEDIALDFEPDCGMDDVNFSPLPSPCPPSTVAPQDNILDLERTVTDNNPMYTTAAEKNNLNEATPTVTKDPLNLRDDLSFFDDQPVASSSMNVSIRNPEASPWRVEFGSLPIKWQMNTYMKPNMTPAFESSFVNFNESKKKHVYTNIVTDTNVEHDLPHVYDDNTSKLKQTSIISFIKEVVEKNAKKKKDKMTQIKTNALFEDLNNTAYKETTTAQKGDVTPKKNAQNHIVSNDQVTPPIHCENSNETENETDNSKDKENSNESVKSSSKKKKKKKKDKDVTYFGFDASDVDQENVSPNKKIDKSRLRALKPRSRAVLQEINAHKGPTRAMLPVAVKSKPLQSSETANKLFDQMKSANEPPVFPDKEPIQTTDTTNTINITEVQNNEDSNDGSVHLFEDVELMHHLKVHRKSYGKAKKAVTFRQNSISDSDVPPSDIAEESASSGEDDLHDLTFKMPANEPKKSVKKKKSKKPKLSKKEEQEAEAWAAGFNSMCEDIEEFDLVVE